MLLTSSGWKITSFLVNLAFTQLEIHLRVKGAVGKHLFYEWISFKRTEKITVMMQSDVISAWADISPMFSKPFSNCVCVGVELERCWHSPDRDSLMKMLSKMYEPVFLEFDPFWVSISRPRMLEFVLFFKDMSLSLPDFMDDNTKCYHVWERLSAQ